MTYLDKANGRITEHEFSDFRTAFQNDIKAYQDKLKAAREHLDAMDQESDEQRTKKDVLKKYQNIQQLDRTMVDALIEYIEVGRNEHKVHRNDLPPIVIHWRF